MTANSNIRLTINFNDPDLDPEEQDEQVQRLMNELKTMDEVETVSRVLDPNPPEGNKASGGFLVGTLTTETPVAQGRSLLGFLSDRFARKPVEIEIEMGGRKMKVTTANREELMQMFQSFLSEQNDASTPGTAANIILIFAANPKSTSQLRLDQEVRDIAEGLRLATYRDQFALESRWAVRPRDIRRAMLERNPRIVHFCGHSEGRSSSQEGRGDQSAQGSTRKLSPVDAAGVLQTPEGLILEDDETGEAKLISGASLASLFKLFADQLECVVLNSCYSEEQAEAIAQHIPYVIGMSRAIGDRAAIEFAVGFYDALGAGRSIEVAYEFGCSAIQMAGIAEHLTPVLKKKLT